MIIRPAGSSALLLEVSTPYAWYAAIAKARDRGDLECEEIVPGAETVLLVGVDPASREIRRRLEQLAAVVSEIAAVSETTTVPEIAAASEVATVSEPEDPGGTVVIPVRWDGEDLQEVARLWGDDPAAVLRETVFTVAFCGFVPGFAYLTGLPEERHLPRRQTPRAAVPAGSVAVAGPYAGIYPRSTPGGWHLLGSSEAVLFDPDREPPALLTPGMRVRMTDA